MALLHGVIIIIFYHHHHYTDVINFLVFVLGVFVSFTRAHFITGPWAVELA
jgi:hypothetical protein